jgi:uncharacterized protein (TIGR02270 family)
MTTTLAIPAIIDRHSEDAAFLWLLRDAAAQAPNYSLGDLAALDNRLEAHLDGLRIAGDTAWDICRAGLEIGEPGEVFVAALLAIDSGDGVKVDAVLAVAQSSIMNLRAFVSALGWLDFNKVEGLASAFCNSNQAIYNYLGISAYALHRIDPGAKLEQGISSNNLILRARSLRAAGELGRSDLLPVIQACWQADDEASRFWSVWSAVLLGNSAAQSQLKDFVFPDSAFSGPASQCAVRILNDDATRQWLSGLAQQKDTLRYALMGAGYTGNPLYIPSLLNQLVVPEYARVAGEAFSMITGVDLAYLDLDGDWPEGYQAGPTEDPGDENVGLDMDEDLPWPNPAAVNQWWSDNEHRFSVGERYLCGERISSQQCQFVLNSGFQCQRQAAAIELALIEPDMALYETRAPGFRQKKDFPEFKIEPVT